MFVYSQNPELDPPQFETVPRTSAKSNSLIGDTLNKSDRQFLSNYYTRIERSRNMTRGKKRKRDTENEVDSILYTTQIDIQNKQMNITSGVKIPSILIGDNFTSPEAHALFKPSENETVIEYLSCRVQVLGDGMIDDHILKMMYTNEEDAIIATFASTHLRTKYMSLK